MKTLLLTGASSGIGRALALRAARAGYAVYAVGRDRAALAALRVKIEAERGFVAVDVTDIALAANAAPLVERALAHFGSIDVLVNNAGFVSSGELRAQTNAELERQLGTHVSGPIALVREALAALSSAGGHVFMLGSGVARVPLSGFGAYPPAKAALRSATAILRRELLPLGIAVTYVDPGAVDTPFMTRAGMAAAPAKLLVSPEEVARKILIAVAKRPRELNAVPWQTMAVALAERFPRVTDFVLARVPTLVGGNMHPADALMTVTPALESDASVSSRASLGVSASTPDEAVVADPAGIDGLPARSGDRRTNVVVPPEPPVRPDASTVTLADAGSAVTDGESANVDGDAFATALEPHRRRMEKLNLRMPFVRELLVPGATLDLGEVALRWAGMPNKNERLITENVLEALTAAGYLERNDDHAYRVVRSP